MKNVKKIIKYSDELIETKEFKSREKQTEAVSKIRKIKGGDYVNIETGEIIKANRSETKRECLDAVKKSMNKNRKVLLYNTAKKVGNVYFVTLTLKETCSYDDFLKKEKSFKDKIRRKYKNICYMAFEQVTKKGLYHLHVFVWSNDNSMLFLNGDTVSKMWNQGTLADVYLIKTNKGLVNATFYVTNYSITKNVENKQKIYDKINGLKYFPTNCRLCKTCGRINKDIDIRDYDENDDVDEIFRLYLKSNVRDCESKILIA